MMPGRFNKQQGLSLIELMVALVIGLLLMAAVVQMFVGSRVTYSMQTELAKLQENARFAMQFLRRDLSQAGYYGCKIHDHYSDDDVTSILSSTTDSSGDDWFIPLIVDDNDFPASDELKIRYTQASAGCVVNEDDIGDDYLRCTTAHGFQQGNILVVADCKYKAIFQMTNDDNDDGTLIEHKQTEELWPGNCIGTLGAQSECTGSATSDPYNSWANATVQSFGNYTYEIKQNSFGQSALYRDSDEMVEGVENMQLLLGVDTDSDGSANCFTTNVANCGASDSQVVAVRVSLLLVSIEDNLVDARPANEFAGTPFEDYTPTDNKLRKVFTSTVTLRNRLIENE